MKKSAWLWISLLFSCSNPPVAGAGGTAQLVGARGESGACVLEFLVSDPAGRQVNWTQLSLRFEDPSARVHERAVPASQLDGILDEAFLPAGGVARGTLRVELGDAGLVAPASGVVVLSGSAVPASPAPATFAFQAECDDF